MDDELKYRKHGNKTQKELAEELHVPKEIVTALELGSHKHPSPALKKRIHNLTEQFNPEDLKDLIYIGRGAHIKEELGPDFRYYIRGLKKIHAINSENFKKLDVEGCMWTIGRVDMDEFQVAEIGK
ncbi:helix-turn-helix domain-containing protein [Methanobacterium congolense]|uniref:HTH cro/C1-type domain-containing protein n=1 Tax=Methanobacterium congolense TaxID=118062 RepID=A0A1D3L4C3_9EURY|nr:helix-turn-helix domain-containing protein [Methanobacterium congolense]SCG86405.1 putative protein [Methanobacterium congolense]